MNNAFYIGATGMQAQQMHVDTIANNLANVNTAGFKKGTLAFSDLVIQGARQAEALSAHGDDFHPLGVHISSGAGVGISGVGRSFEPGDLKKTGSRYDLAIRGEGFLEVALPDGTLAYSRGGSLKVSRDGYLVTSAGYPFRPSIRVPEDAKNLEITAGGSVRVTIAGQGEPVEIGQLELVRFSSPELLTAQDGNLYRPNRASGEPGMAAAMNDGSNEFVQGALESANVRLVDEMVGLMIAQRAYEASVKVVQASDEMAGMLNNLRK